MQRPKCTLRKAVLDLLATACYLEQEPWRRETFAALLLPSFVTLEGVC